jgi:hypothetical protein
MKKRNLTTNHTNHTNFQFEYSLLFVQFVAFVSDLPYFPINCSRDGTITGPPLAG